MATKKSKGLGKGLDSMFGVKSVADVMATKPNESSGQNVEIGKLFPGKYQARVSMPAAGLKELAASIKEKGILNPIVVRAQGDHFEILAGERRFRAAKLAGLKTVPVTVLEVNDEDALAVGLIENLQREDLNVMEAAVGLQQLCEEFNYTHEEVAKAVGRSRSAVTNLLRLLGLHEKVQKMLREGLLEMGHTRPLLTLPKEKQLELAQQIAAKELSVRQAEALASGEKQKKNQTREEAKSRDIRRIEEALADKLGLSVNLTANAKGKGKMVISFANHDEFELILEKFRISKGALL